MLHLFPPSVSVQQLKAKRKGQGKRQKRMRVCKRNKVFLKKIIIVIIEFEMDLWKEGKTENVRASHICGEKMPVLL